MERQHQELGGRYWRGEALLKLQNQLYQVFIETYRELRAFIISGCNVSAGSGGGLYHISAGYVFLDNDICVFDGASDAWGPIYLNKLETLTTNELYNDGIAKPTEKHVKAIIGSDALPYLEIAVNNSTRRLPQAIAPISDSLSLISSTVYASATAVSNCYGGSWVKVPEILNNTQSPIVGTADVWYKRTAQIITMDVQAISLDDAGPWTWQLPAGYFPTRTVRHKLNISGYEIIINPFGVVVLSGAGSVSIAPQEHVAFCL